MVDRDENTYQVIALTGHPGSKLTDCAQEVVALVNADSQDRWLIFNWIAIQIRKGDTVTDVVNDWARKA